MSLLNSLYSGVSGLQTHQTMMDVIGNNIANVNTIGYKEQTVTFADAYSQILKAGTNSSSASGGTNSFQIGLGVQVSSIDRNWNSGTTETTTSTTDLALNGNGLFIVNSNGQNYYTRAGSFTFDDSGKLVTSTGAVVQGKVANTDGVLPSGNNVQDIIVDKNSKIPAVSTTNVSWGGNLKSSAELTRTENVVLSGNINSDSTAASIDQSPITVYNEDGTAYTLQVSYTKTATNTYDMSYTVSLASDTTNTAITSGSITGLTFAKDSSGNYTMDAASLAKFDGTANKVVDANNKLNFLITGSTLTQNASTETLSGSADENRKANVVTGEVTVYDSLGTSHQLSLTFTKIGTNQWSWSASIPATDTKDGKEAVTTGSILFNSDGTLTATNISPNNPTMSFVPAGGADPTTIKLDFGSGFNGVTQTSSSSVISSLSQNGSAAASLSDMNIDQYGNITGVYSNGNTKILAQISAATFTNIDGLVSVGNNMYSAYANAGTATVGSMGDETGTTVTSKKLEQSNVDLADEFTKMIVAQRGFQANSKVITTSDSLLQVITNLVQ
jgi:flagellar hook protein FlgE